jgi:hypothetical protein
MSRAYYDDNFGFYDIQSEEDIEFYREMQRISVRKKCQGCGRMVKIKPDCATRIEQGGDLG